MLDAEALQVTFGRGRRQVVALNGASLRAPSTEVDGTDRPEWRGKRPPCSECCWAL